MCNGHSVILLLHKYVELLQVKRILFRLQNLSFMQTSNVRISGSPLVEVPLLYVHSTLLCKCIIVQAVKETCTKILELSGSIIMLVHNTYYNTITLIHDH